MRTVHGSDYPLKPVQKVSILDASAASPAAEVMGQEEIKLEISEPAETQEIMVSRMFEEMSNPGEVKCDQFTIVEVETKGATSYLVSLQP